MRLYSAMCGMLALLAVGRIAADGEKDDREKLQGTWKSVYHEVGGKGFKPMNDVRVHIENDRWTEIAAGEWVTKSSFRLDSDKRPKRVESTILENRLIPESKGSKIVAIYEIEGDRLKVRSRGTSIRIPTKFKTEKGGSGTLTIYERVKP